MALFRLRQIIAGEIAGDWGELGGVGAQLRFLATHLEACIEDDMEATGRLAGEECELLAHMARSSVCPLEVSRIAVDPGRDCRLRVVSEQRRTYGFSRPAKQALRIILGAAPLRMLARGRTGKINPPILAHAMYRPLTCKREIHKKITFSVALGAGVVRWMRSTAPWPPGLGPGRGELGRPLGRLTRADRASLLPRPCADVKLLVFSVFFQEFEWGIQIGFLLSK